MGILWDTPEKRAAAKARQIKGSLEKRIQEMRVKHLSSYALQPQQKQRIISCSAHELACLMDNHEFTSLDIILTFIERASTIGLANNYVIDEMFDSAVQIAKQCDQVRLQNPLKKCWKFGDSLQDAFPPFFGVPVSLKESILIKDRISYAGVVTPINDVPTSDSNIVVLVRKMGFIPFVRSSTSQAGLAFETNNNILGYAKNPWSTDRSCGGSSGGECGLVASYCSPFGVGSDHLGDSKVACQFTGLFTLKPFSRYCNRGIGKTSKYMMGLPFRHQCTPIAKSVQDIVLWNQFMCNQSHYDLVPKRQRDSYIKINDFQQNVLQEQRPLKIAYFSDISNAVKCSPSHRRAVAETVKVLEKQGHSTVQIEIKEAQYLNLYLFRLLWSSRKLQILRQAIGEEKPIHEYQRFITYASWPWFYKRIVASFYSPRAAQQLLALKEMNAKDYFISIYQYNKAQKKVHGYLQRQEIDAIICPGFFMPAYKHGNSSDFTYCATFSTVWSMMQYPVGCLPITTVREDEQGYKDSQADRMACLAQKSMQQSAGLPVGIQVVSYPGSQQLILRLMRAIDSHFCFGSKHRSAACGQANG